MTNMDALTIPAAGGLDSTALVIGDFSAGNDGILLCGGEQRVPGNPERVLLRFDPSYMQLVADARL